MTGLKALWDENRVARRRERRISQLEPLPLLVARHLAHGRSDARAAARLARPVGRRVHRRQRATRSPARRSLSRCPRTLLADNVQRAVLRLRSRATSTDRWRLSGRPEQPDQHVSRARTRDEYEIENTVQSVEQARRGRDLLVQHPPDGRHGLRRGRAIPERAASARGSS